MPRTPCVEYENAVYHVMACGDRRESIVHDDGDRELFLDSFAETCGRTGWQVFAWVLTDNHYRSRREGPTRDHGIRRAMEIVAEGTYA